MNIFDWKLSPRHIELLSLFRRPRAVADPRGYWEEQLSETVFNAVDRFSRAGALVPGDLEEKVQTRFTIQELRQFLARHSAEGGVRRANKSALVKQAISVAPEEIATATSELVLYRRTAVGQKIIDDFAIRKDEALVSAQAESFVLLKQGLLREAVARMADFRQDYLNPTYPGGSTNIDFLEILFVCAPPVIGRLNEEDWHALRVATAMNKIWWNTRETAVWLPPTFRTAVNDNARAIRLLRRNTIFRTNIRREHGLGFRRVSLRFEPTNPLCDGCRKLQGASFDISAVPDVPSKGCTSENGCIAYPDGFDWDAKRFCTIVAQPHPTASPETKGRRPTLEKLEQWLAEGFITPSICEREKRELEASRGLHQEAIELEKAVAEIFVPLCHADEEAGERNWRVVYGQGSRNPKSEIVCSMFYRDVLVAEQRFKRSEKPRFEEVLKSAISPARNPPLPL